MHIQFIQMRWGSGDNYCYVLSDDDTKDSWVIDPAEPHEVLPKLKGLDITLKAIVNTHHHYDHAGGNKQLNTEFHGLPIIAGKDSPLVSYTPSHNEVIQLGTNLEITALHTPCHTQDSICYFVKDLATNEKCVFTGDTLFTSGCGRFFEGTPKEMDTSLNKILGRLPSDTVVYPGHEYTASNVRFSKSVLKGNKWLEELEAFTDANEFTTGKFTIGDEKNFNPFMRLTDPEVLKATGVTDKIDVMGKLREMKNKF